MAEKKLAKKTPKTTIVAAIQVEHKPRRVVIGTVVSDKMLKTRVVRIERSVRDHSYGKIMNRADKVKVHDENNKSKEGDLVSIIQCRPMSKEKRWALKEILRSGSGNVLLVDEAAS